MADIELVIKIDENIYKHIKNTWRKRRGSIPESNIAFGIPLPKGHGDLIDKQQLLKQPMDKANYPSNYVKIAQAIIKADNAEEEYAVCKRHLQEDQNEKMDSSV